MKKTATSSRGERGSALLIVFVFAAAVAIMLYMEMPVAVFEAQREKEQLLIDRGNEYALAAKLYFRKLRQYPPTIEAMENTNRMRFLRKRFKDPFTGKDDWRLLHAAPNGMLTDSKVKPANSMAGAGNSPLNSNNNNASTSSPFGGFNSPSSSSNSVFAGFNSANSSSTQTGAAEVVVPNLPQRPPAIAANGNSTAQDANGSTGQGVPAATDNMALNAGAPPSPLPANTDPNVQQPNTPQTAAANGQTLGPNGLPLSPNTQAATGTNTNNPMSAAPGGAPNPNQNPAMPQAAGAGMAAPPANSPFRLNSANPGSALSSTLGTMQGGGIGIAGVASKAEGHSIKVVNDQENYSLWEFYYDPTKDAMRAAAGALAQMGSMQGTGQASNSGSNSGTSSSSGFGNFGGGLSGMQNSSSGGFGQQGSTNTNSGFGGFGSSGFGSSNTSASSQPTAPASAPTNSTTPPQ